MNPIGEPVIKAIDYAIKHEQKVAIETAHDGFIKIKPLSIFTRIWHWNDSKFHEERLSTLASVVAQVISAQQRLSIAVAAEDPTLKMARSLLKDLQRKRINTTALEILKKEVIAAKLGISSNTLDHNPGLQKFTELYHLERYLLRYNHALHIDPTTQKASIIKEGNFQPWEQVLEETKTWLPFSNKPQLAWIYGPDGVQNKDMYEWKKLKPFIKADPADWNHQYVFEFCACYNPNSIKNGNHSWLRLKTPTGDIYSVGLYRPDKVSFYDNLKAPLRIKPGYLMQPDVSEFWDFAISTIDFTITEENFLKIKEAIETDKKNEDLVFQLFNNNCLLYCKKLAMMSGVDLPTSQTALHFIVPPSIFSPVSKFMNTLPTFIQKVCLVATTVFLNVLQIALGGCHIDKNLNAQQRKRAVPHLNSLRDIFDVSKTYLNHPNTLAFKTRQNVLEWRKKQMERLEQTESDPVIRKENQKKISLSLPPSYYTVGTELRDCLV